MAVVIPCYNSGAFLRAAVDSALGQTHRLLECIVVDDGSTDVATLQQLADIATLDRVRVISTPNMGLPTARNNGIAVTDAKYFLPLDADDLIDPRYVAEAVCVMESDPGVGIVYCRARLFGDVEKLWELPPFSFDVMLVENLIFATSLFRRADWLTVEGYDAEMTRGREDHDFNLRILGLGRSVHRLEGQYFAYRQHGDSLKDVTGRSRQILIANNARIMRNNLSLYSDRAEDLFAYIFRQADQINDLKHRYALFEALRRRLPGVMRSLSKVRQLGRVSQPGDSSPSA